MKELSAADLPDEIKKAGNVEALREIRERIATQGKINGYSVISV